MQSYLTIDNGKAGTAARCGRLATLALLVADFTPGSLSNVSMLEFVRGRTSPFSSHARAVLDTIAFPAILMYLFVTLL